MKTLAAVLVETGQPLRLAELEIPTLKAGQVLVEIAYSGVCHTQLLESRGHRGQDAYLPHALGHEGSGVVLEIGPEVAKVKPGDPVTLSWIKGSGRDVPGTVYRWQDRTVNAGAITTFSRHAVISENRLTRLPKEMPLPLAALLGCAIPTGMGAVLNTAQARPGQSLAIFGLGGVGLCALAAGRLAGCQPILALDIRPERLSAARNAGATHILDAGGPAVLQEILRLCPQGVDMAIEATGRPSVMQLALECVHARGGKEVIVGNAHSGDQLTINPKQLNMGKQILGTWGGDNNPDVHFPQYIEWLLNHKINLDPLTEARYPLDEINQALDDLESGRVLRPLVEMKSHASRR